MSYGPGEVANSISIKSLNVTVGTIEAGCALARSNRSREPTCLSIRKSLDVDAAVVQTRKEHIERGRNGSLDICPRLLKRICADERTGLKKAQAGNAFAALPGRPTVATAPHAVIEGDASFARSEHRGGGTNDTVPVLAVVKASDTYPWRMPGSYRTLLINGAGMFLPGNSTRRPSARARPVPR